jgi:deoxyribonuclease V
MEFNALHSWNLTPREAVALQRDLSEQVTLQERLPSVVRTLAGVDVSYEKHGREFFAGVVLLAFPSLDPIAWASARGQVDFPYIPGLLSFRELPVVLEAFRKLQAVPDLVMVDGQGIAHPRRLGIASHLGLWIEIPTIGCAKSRLCGVHDEVGLEKGAGAPLYDRDEVIGRVLRSRTGVKPLYVSPGYAIGVDHAAQWVLDSCHRYRMPEPTRQAHLFTNRLRSAARE